MQSNKKLSFELQNVISQFKRSIALKNNHSKLKGAEKHILFLVHELNNNQPVTISEIAKQMGVTLAAVTHQISTLEKQNLIRRLPDNNDKRVILIDLTRKGDTQVVKLKKEFAQKTQILVDFLGEKDTNDLIRLVKKMSKFRGFNE